MPEFTEAELTAMWHVLPTDEKGDLASAIAELDAWKQARRAERDPLSNLSERDESELTCP